MRFCELENVAHLWKNTSNLKRKESINHFLCLYKSFFNVKDSFYDISKFYIYKVEMIANKIGVIKKNEFCNYEIEILSSNEPVSNETQSLGLLNISQIQNRFQIRLGEVVWFYFTSLF